MKDIILSLILIGLGFLTLYLRHKERYPDRVVILWGIFLICTGIFFLVLVGVLEIIEK